MQLNQTPSPFSQQLSKAELIIQLRRGESSEEFKLPLHINPNKIEVSRGLEIQDAANASGHRPQRRVKRIEPLRVKLPALVFDTYQARTSVRTTIIDRLEDAVVRAHDTKKGLAIVRFNWGGFTSPKHDDEYSFLIKSLNVAYTMFLPDGTPVRAEVSLTLEQYLLVDKSTDGAAPDTEVQKHQVRAGETAQSIAAEKYGDPRKWRQICEANKIDDPMKLKPGMNLMVPPARPAA